VRKRWYQWLEGEQSGEQSGDEDDGHTVAVGVEVDAAEEQQAEFVS